MDENESQKITFEHLLVTSECPYCYHLFTFEVEGFDSYLQPGVRSTPCSYCETACLKEGYADSKKLLERQLEIMNTSQAARFPLILKNLIRYIDLRESPHAE